MMSTFRRILGAAILLSAAAVSAHAALPLVALFVVDGGTAEEKAASEGGYTATLVAEAERALSSKGAEITEAEDETRSGEAPRWSIGIHCTLEGGMLSWWFEIRDTQEKTLLSADAFSAAAGLSVRDILAESADSLAARWERSIAAEPPAEPISFRLKFVSWDTGAKVTLGSVAGGGDVIAAIDGKVTEAAYIALVNGKPITLEVTKEGYWPVTIDLPQGPVSEPIQLPHLMWKAAKNIIASWSPSRAQGFSVSYRYYPMPDAFFLRADLSPWKQDDGGIGAYPVSHLGLRLGGGFYLPFAKTARYRLSLGAGTEMVWTVIGHEAELQKTTGMDILVEPIIFGLEFHLPRAALVLEQRFPFAVGGNSGFLDRGWLQNSSGGMLHASLGVMYKW